MTGERYLIAIGSPDSPGMGASHLRRVESDVNRVSEFFTGPKQGFTRVLEKDIRVGAPSAQIRDNLAKWFSAPERSENDCVVVYIAGHADSGAKFGDHILMTSDSDARNVYSVVHTSELARIFFGGHGIGPRVFSWSSMSATPARVAVNPPPFW